MKTPICDFVNEYVKSNSLRLHMPGHKGVSFDITEIEGADVLYQPRGIILESEKNASRLFGTARTVYSAEGSSLAIKAMLYLALMNWRHERLADNVNNANNADNANERPVILAARNVHKTFVSAAAMLDIDVEWIFPETDGILSCEISAGKLEKALSDLTELQKRKPFGVYVTSPDYLGNVADVAALSAVCKKHSVMLLVDNAHGAYLKFVTPSKHPMDLGADMCCDSAHKTLPVLTGGAYLHISQTSESKEWLSANADMAMSLFASTSPSYLIMQSLDRANLYIHENYIQRRLLSSFVEKIIQIKGKLIACGYRLCGNEPMKITIAPKSYGYSGEELAKILSEKNIVCEFSDPDFVVMMLTPDLGDKGLETLCNALLSIPFNGDGKEVFKQAPSLTKPHRATSIREAVFSPSVNLPVEQAVGKIAANVTVGCPPAVPIVVCGEVISESAVECFKYYGIEACRVVE